MDEGRPVTARATVRRRSGSRRWRGTAAGAALVVVPLALLVLALRGGAAAADDASGSEVSVDVAAQLASFTAHGSAANDLVVTSQWVPITEDYGATEYTFDDVLPIAPGAGCDHPDPSDETVAVCSVPDSRDPWPVLWVRLGAGDDRADVRLSTSGEASVLGGIGDDTLTARVAVLIGGPGDDTLIGSFSCDGGSGADTLDGCRYGRGGSGDDTLIGSVRSDTLRGGKGDDLIRGGRAKDVLYGNSGDDTIYGNSGNDIISGGPGKDRLSGGPGRDTVTP